MKENAKAVAIDYPILGSAFLLILAGLTCLYSISTGSERSLFQTGFGRQVVWFFLGTGLIVAVLAIPLQWIFRGVYFFYGLSLVLLVLVFFIGKEKIHRWINVGIFHFQPSELAKIATLLALARFFSKEKILGWKRLLGTLGLVMVPIILIIKEPDIGTATVFFALWVGMLIWAGMSIKIALWVLVPFLAFVSGFHPVSFIGFMIVVVVLFVLTKQKWWVGLGVGALCVCLGRMAPIIWSTLASYQQQRILIFLGMKSDPHGAAYQIIQSKVAIGSGGILGKGFLNGSQTQLRFLPEQHTDFVLSVLGEEFGFIGIALVMSTFLFLFSRIFRVAKTARYPFASFIAAGSVSILAFQFLVNSGMTVGLFPVTGLPIPFLSYGGSSLFMAMVLVGLTVNVSSHRYEY